MKFTEESIEQSLEFVGDKIYSLSEAAKCLKVTRQAIFLAIKMKRLKAFKYDSFWRINSKELNYYYKNRYSRELSRHEGILVFNKENGKYSVKDAAKILKVNLNRLYYMIRMGKLTATRKGNHIVIKKEDLDLCVKKHNKKSVKKIVL